MNSKIYYHVYVSSAVKLMSNQELHTILTVCRNNNARFKITGMLLHKDGNFMQALEGAKDDVLNLMQIIKKDPRHRGIITLVEGYTDNRQFSDWSTGFQELNSPEVRLVPGYSEFLNAPLTETEFSSDPSRCQILLGTFKNNINGPITIF